MDRLTKNQRSRNISKVKVKDTKIDLRVSREFFSKGFRYLLYKYLSGKLYTVLKK